MTEELSNGGGSGIGEGSVIVIGLGLVVMSLHGILRFPGLNGPNKAGRNGG